MHQNKQLRMQAPQSKPLSSKHIRPTPKWEFAPLDKGSFTPIYFQIQTQLLQKIQSGQLRAGDPLPSEEELGRIFNVSRMTARHALQALKSQGFASRHKGQGTFVSRPRVEKDIAHLSGFTDVTNSSGRNRCGGSGCGIPFGHRCRFSDLSFAPLTPSRRPSRRPRRRVASTTAISGRQPVGFFSRFSLSDTPRAVRDSREPGRRGHRGPFG